jgi:hypothetical protein
MIEADEIEEKLTFFSVREATCLSCKAVKADNTSGPMVRIGCDVNNMSGALNSYFGVKYENLFCSSSSCKNISGS